MISRPDARRVVVRIGWLFVGAAVLHFLSVAYQKYGHVDAGSYGMFWSRREWLWTHLTGGAMTVLMGPLQLFGRLRSAYPRFHRWTGRVYLLGVLIGCVGATGLISTSPAGIGIRLAFAATGIAWFCTALIGFIAIRRKQQQVHRRWMVRNYLVTLAPISFRVSLLVPGVMALASPIVMIPLLLWLSWALPLLVYEAWLAAARFSLPAASRSSQPA